MAQEDFKDLLTMMTSYVSTQEIDALINQPELRDVFGMRPIVRLTRRERLLCRVKGRIDCFRERVAIKIAPWLRCEDDF